MNTRNSFKQSAKKLIMKISLVIGTGLWSLAGKMQRLHINIVPINFYSNTPSRKEIKSSYEFLESDPPYLNRDIFKHDVLSNTLGELIEFSKGFNPDIEGDEDNCHEYYWNNSQFSYSDAMAYYCFIQKYLPKNIVEIGSGFSSLVALEALKKTKSGSLTTIEPFPRPFLETNPTINLVRKKAQQINVEFLNSTLEDGDILFIDSTHTVKTGSDCLHIFLRLLPHIKKDIIVHVHDIFLPFGIPMEWQLEKRIFWTEQYLLMALLIDNPKAKLLYSSTYSYEFDREQLDRLMDGRFPSGGSSVWFSYRGSYGHIVTHNPKAA